MTAPTAANSRLPNAANAASARRPGFREEQIDDHMPAAQLADRQEGGNRDGRAHFDDLIVAGDRPHPSETRNAAKHADQRATDHAHDRCNHRDGENNPPKTADARASHSSVRPTGSVAAISSAGRASLIVSPWAPRRAVADGRKH
jgi:hypothetical protein